MDLLLETHELLNKIVKSSPQNFSGIGLIAYDSKKFDSKSHCNLRPNFRNPQYYIKNVEFSDYLAQIADYHNTLHDGFHFMNESGILTHVAQYFVPPVVENLIPNQDHGVRLHSSMCGSTLEGVLFIGVICSDYKIYIFQSGKDVSELVSKKVYELGEEKVYV